MPGIFGNTSFDLVGFAVGVAERHCVLPQLHRMQTGDVLIGLQSSGIHSNGFSLLRSLTKAAGINYSAAAAFDPTQSFGDVFLTPTRIYVSPVLALAKACKLKGAAPITSGGISGSLSRSLPSDLRAKLRSESWVLPAAFRWIAGNFKISCQEMASTFNCGIGMVLVLAKEDQAEVLRILREMHEEPVVLGELEQRTGGQEQVYIEGAESSWLMLPELGVSLPFPQVLSSLQDPKTVSRRRVLVLAGDDRVPTPLRSLLEASEVPAFPAVVVAVATVDGRKGETLKQALAAGIPVSTIDGFESAAMVQVTRDTAAKFTQKLQAFLDSVSADLIIILDDFDTRLMTRGFCSDWQDKLIVVRPSLLPSALRSRDPIAEALESGMCVTGCTVYVGVDDGSMTGKIMVQETTQVLEEDTQATLHERIVEECENKALPEAVRQLVSGTWAGKKKHRQQSVMSPDAKARPHSSTSARTGDAKRYDMRGVSADKGDVHAAIKSMDKGLYPNAFCKIVPDNISRDPAHAIVMHADGAGTKSSLAYMYWKHTGDLSVWKGIAQDSIVMNIDDLLCVGVVDNICLSSTVGRNKGSIPREVIAAVISGTQEFAQDLNRYGLGLVLTGGETADVGDLVRTIIMDTTVVARIPRCNIIDNGNIRPGNVIVGLSSSGQASYETEYNSGIGSNGLTSARHDVFEHALASLYPESFDAALPEDLVYSGKYKLDELVKIDSIDGYIPAGKLVLSPTRTYAPIMKKIFENGLREKIDGMIHCSGGAQTKVLHFVEGVRVVKDSLFPTPTVFRMIQECSQTSWDEMYKVFNMGHRMEIYTDATSAEAMIEISRSFGVDAQIIGHVEAAEPGQKLLSISSEHGAFEYGS